MSSIMSALTGSARTVPDNKHRRRSQSESRNRIKPERHRVAAITFENSQDVATAINVEIGRAVLLNPDINTGTFFRSLGNSRMDLTKSDTTIVITAAVLKHVGNDKMAKAILAKSATCSKYFEELGLDNPKVNAMFTTMMFALSPNFAAMVNKTLEITIKRVSELTQDEYSDRQMLAAAKTLVGNKSVLASEVDTFMRRDSESGNYTLDRSNSIQRTPTDMIAPDDSASVAGKTPRSRQYISDNHIMTYINRKKSGPEPEFDQVFRSVSPPVPISVKNNKQGLGYKADLEVATDAIQRVNAILGKHTVPSVDLKTGKVNTRRPRVEDYLESEEPSGSILKAPTVVSAVNWQNLDSSKFRPPSPTDVALPDSVIIEELTPATGLKRVDSLEFLKLSLS